MKSRAIHDTIIGVSDFPYQHVRLWGIGGCGSESVENATPSLK